MPPVVIERNENEQCMVEGSINSCRISIKVRAEVCRLTHQVDPVVESTPGFQIQPLNPIK